MAFERAIPDLNLGLFPHRTLSLICNIIKSSAASKVELICFLCHLGKLRPRKVPRAAQQVRRLGRRSSFLTSMRLVSLHHSCSDIVQDTLAQTEQRIRQLCLRECMYTHSHTHTHILTHTHRGTCYREHPEERKLPVKLIASLQNSLESFEIIG